jgi:hypothetical protein
VGVIPFPTTPGASEPETPSAPTSGPTPPTLRLVAEHDHVWQLRAVEYDETLEVRRYECEACDDVLFR